MDAYMFQAGIYCGHCAKQIMNRLSDRGVNPDRISRGDSESWPQGPFSNGGCEADCPQHCGSCGVFLENPLTGDGYEYVAEALEQFCDMPRSASRETLVEWARFYKDENAALDNSIARFDLVEC